MGLFKRKGDPISDRSRALAAEIASLESQIKQLNSKLDEAPPGPRLRSTAVPHAAHSATSESSKEGQPIFETVQHHVDAVVSEGNSKHFNDLGVRKYDLPGLFRRIRNQFQGPTANNPKLVSYLAAGSIKGLRPLRYEKRVARNRFVALFIALVLLMWGIIAIFFGR
jgi:hypothetical protein